MKNSLIKGYSFCGVKHAEIDLALHELSLALATASSFSTLYKLADTEESERNYLCLDISIIQRVFDQHVDEKLQALIALLQAYDFEQGGAQ